MFLARTRIGELVGHGGRVRIAVEAGVERVGCAIHTGATEVIDQKVAREGRDPGIEAAALEVEAGEVAIKLEKDLLGEIFGVRGAAGEAIADAVDAVMLGKHELAPGFAIPAKAAGHLAGERQSFGYLFGRLLQLSLKGMLRRKQCIARGSGSWGGRGRGRPLTNGAGSLWPGLPKRLAHAGLCAGRRERSWKYRRRDRKRDVKDAHTRSIRKRFTAGSRADERCCYEG